MEEEKEAILNILKKYTFNKSLIESATEDSDIIVDLKINSARIVDIILDIEDRFGIDIPMKNLEQIKTIGDLVAVVEVQGKA